MSGRARYSLPTGFQLLHLQLFPNCLISRPVLLCEIPFFTATKMLAVLVWPFRGGGDSWRKMARGNTRLG